MCGMTDLCKPSDLLRVSENCACQSETCLCSTTLVSTNVLEVCLSVALAHGQLTALLAIGQARAADPDHAITAGLRREGKIVAKLFTTTGSRAADSTGATQGDLQALHHTGSTADDLGGLAVHAGPTAPALDAEA